MGKAQLNSSTSLSNLTSQLQPGDLLYIGNSTTIKHVVMWLGANGTNLDGTPSTVPLVISSHDNTPAIFDTLSLNANGYPTDGKAAFHLPPPGVQILPFAPGNWFYNNFILAARLLPTSSTGPLKVPTGGISGTTNSMQGYIINNSTVTFSQAETGTFNGTISGTGRVIKAGVGGVVLAAANTYSGGTTLYAGSLIINNASALGTGSVSLKNAGKLVINTTASIAGSLDWSGGSIDWKPGTVLNINQALKNTGEGGKIMISSASGLKMGANTIATFGSTNFTAGDIQITRPQNSTFNGTISILSGKVIYNVTNF
jgi:autotransporter-associated beta strand protein